MTVQFLNPAGLSRGTYSHVAVVTAGRVIHVSGQVAFEPLKCFSMSSTDGWEPPSIHAFFCNNIF